MEHLAHLDAVVGQLGPGRLDVEHHQVRPCTEPGVADVTPVPKMTEHAEPGGASFTTRKSAPAAKSASSRHPSALEKHVGERYHQDLEFHVHELGSSFWCQWPVSIPPGLLLASTLAPLIVEVQERIADRLPVARADGVAGLTDSPHSRVPHAVCSRPGAEAGQCAPRAG
jgi:hypothetical protein